MRLLKLAFISAIVLFVLVTGISLFIPSHIRLAKVITIKPAKDSIFWLLKNKEQWHRWHPSFLNNEHADMLSRIETHVVSEKDSVLKMQWRQKGKKPLNMGWQLFHASGNDSATLQWDIDFNLRWYPWQKIGSLFYENNYGAMMEQGLYNLKQEVEREK